VGMRLTLGRVALFVAAAEHEPHEHAHHGRGRHRTRHRQHHDGPQWQARGEGGPRVCLPTGHRRRAQEGDFLAPMKTRAGQGGEGAGRRGP